MIPSAWEAVILSLGTYRLVRLIGWDDFPLAYKVRSWVIGEYWVPVGAIGRVDEIVTDEGGILVRGTLSEVGARVLAGEDLAPSLPGKQPPSEVEGVRPAYRRPTLAHLVHCPFCQGWWVSLFAYLCWLAWPTGVLYAAAPLALSGAVGLIAKNLDP